MKKTAEAKNILVYDKRVTDRMVSSGKISHSDMEQHLKSLPDLTDECEDIMDTVATLPSKGE